MCFKVNTLQRRERSNLQSSKERLLSTFSERFNIQGKQNLIIILLIFLGLSMVLSACDKVNEIPPLEINPDAGYSNLTPNKDQSKLAQISVNEKSPITVRSMLLAEKVVQQLPENVNTRFSSTIGYLWGWLELSNQGLETELLLRWEYQGVLKGEFSFIANQTKKMRTWTRLMTRGDETGEWTLSLLTAKDRKILQRIHFEIYTPETSSVQVPYVSLISTTNQDLTQEKTIAPKMLQSKLELKEKQILPDDQASSLVQLIHQKDDHTISDATSVSEVERLVVSTSIKHRRPIGVSDRFQADIDRLWGYIEVKHSGPPTLLLMEWWREGDLRSRLKVRVGESLRWRTWSWQRLRPQRDTGHWTLKVLTPDKKLLAETPFFVESSSKMNVDLKP